MTLNIKQLTLFLSQHNIEYKIFNKNSDKKYRPANFLNKIRNGIYHVTKEFSGDLGDIYESVIIVEETIPIVNENTLIEVKNPQLVHYLISQLFEVKKTASIHPTAIIDSNATIGENVYIGPYCVIDNSIIEDNVIIESNVRVYDNVQIKSGAKIDSNSTIGPEGVVWVWSENGERVKQAQLGGVVIGKNCYLGTDVTIVRGSLSENTRIGENSVISHGCKIGHGAIIGKMVHMANNVSLAGNTIIKDRVYLGSGSIIPSNITIPANCIVGAGAMVNKNFNEEYCTLIGVPAKILYKNNYNKKGSGTPIPFKNV